ncbi:MBL fold metallo-hydrolase [Leeuwenhoekiella sp. A16]|uniref:MBL fold metallo-hydrolase n=1 Tax=unclassified Leeuwenhoekiella TaxID=2615029 RepID=UPI003A80DBEE
MKKLALTGLTALALIACKTDNKSQEAEVTETQETAMTTEETASSDFDLTPISHASAVFNWDDTVFYIDPVGGAAAYDGEPEPAIILVTDIHGDHLDAETLNAIKGDSTKIIVPQAVADQLEGDIKSQLTIINNGETQTIDGFSIEAIPMYNLREEAKQFHTKGRGNGYVLEKDGMRVYFSGDTEDIPEMRDLKDIDKAFVCMNLPYTMTVDKAAEAVLAFKPKEVYPYHYRGTEGLSDVDKFKELVNAGDADIEVVQLDWYPDME